MKQQKVPLASPQTKEVVTLQSDAVSVYFQYMNKISLHLSQQSFYSLQQFSACLSSLTSNYLHFVPYRQNAATSTYLLPFTEGRHSNLVVWDNFIYGALQIQKVPPSSPLPPLLSSEAKELGTAFGWVLSCFDNEIFVRHHLTAIFSESVNYVKMLTPRSHKVLELLVKGMNKEQIACNMRISKRTVEKYQEQIYSLLQVHSVMEAQLLGIKAGLLDQ